MADHETVVVVLNGTDENPYNCLGLTQNPFPQIGKAEYQAAITELASLGGDPIPHGSYDAYIRMKLLGFSPEFVDLCVKNFRPGVIVEFAVTWGDK